MNNILLSICIPTYNRAEILKVSLLKLLEETNKIDDKSKIEILVSDNCSTDNTQTIVNNFIEKGLHITYSKNPVNVGSNGNFLKCFGRASGKYIWLLGDDDPLADKSIKRILDIIEEGDYGLIHINNIVTNEHNNIIYDDNELFLEYVSFWITFMSANIFRSEVVKSIEAPEQYLNTWLVQVPFFISSALSKEKNIVVNDKILNDSLAGETNGGYNIFEVFVKNYLGIFHDFLDNKQISKFLYYKEIKISRSFIMPYFYKLILKRRICNFETSNGFSIMCKYFGMYKTMFFLLNFLLKKICCKFIFLIGKL